MPVFRVTKAQGVSPHLSVAGGDHGRLKHRWMPIQSRLHLDRGDVLAAGDDDVLGAVLDLDVTVGVHHAEIAGVEPAAREGFCGRLRDS